MTADDVASTTQISTLKVFIGDDWNANDFSVAFDSISKLYQFNEILDRGQTERRTQNYTDRRVKRPQLEWMLTLLSDQVCYNSYKVFGHPDATNRNPNDYLGKFAFELRVKSVNYNSPGSIDFVGFGKALEVIRDWFNRYNPNESERLDNELKRKEIEARDLALVQQKINMMKELGVPIPDITALIGLEMLHLNKLEQLHKRRQITGMEMREE